MKTRFAIFLLAVCVSAQSVTPGASTTPQSATVTGVFSVTLSATVLDGTSTPVSGATVSFTAPSLLGASGTFANGSTVTTAVTNGSGVATATTFTANTLSGTYNVSAAVISIGGYPTANFVLTNIAGLGSVMTVNFGTTPQSALVSSTFAVNIGVTMVDQFSNPVSGVSITFTAPSSGASGTFSSGGTNVTSVSTNGSGVATASAFTANSTAGSYSVLASSPGVATVIFSLSNTGGTTNTIPKFSGNIFVSSSLTDNGTAVSTTEKLGVNNATPGTWIDAFVGGSPSAANEIRCAGYQCAFELLNAAATQNWHFGIDDADGSKLKIGGGYSPGQGITPDIVIDSTHTVNIGNAPLYSAAFNISTGPTAWGGGDSIFWLSHEGTAANNESLIRHEHFSNFAVTAARPQPIFACFANRGTRVSGVAVTTGDMLCEVGGRGYTGAAYSDDSGIFRLTAAGTFTNTSWPSNAEIWTTASGATTPVKNFAVGSDGHILLEGVTSTGATGTGKFVFGSSPAAWTPVDASAAALTLTVNTASWTQVGKLVHVECTVTYPATADTHNASIGGLPVANNGTLQPSFGAWTNSTTGSGMAIGIMNTSTSVIFYRTDTTAIYKNADFTGKTLIFSFDYIVP